MRRAVVSISTNISEGAARRSRKEFIQFLYIARASAVELETLLEISKRTNMINGDKIENQKELCLEVNSFDKAVEFLELIGCKPKSFQENKREIWELDNIEITINEWPFLEPLVETGIMGALAMFAIFLIICWYGFKRYRNTNDFSFPVVILIFVLHFIQTQTSFNTSTSLLMIFILMAYISAQDSHNILHTPSLRVRTIILSLGLGAITTMLVISSIIPAVHNHNAAKVLKSGDFEKRLQIYQSLHSLHGYPPEVLRAITETYTGVLVRNFDALKDNQKARKDIAIEFNAILDLYEKHYDRYSDNLKYIINYVRTIHVARLFDVDRLDRANELTTRAKEISVSVPQVFWLSALQAKYIGDEELALEEIGNAIIMAENGRAKFESSGQLDDFYYTTMLKIEDLIKTTSGSKKKVYFNLGDI